MKTFYQCETCNRLEQRDNENLQLVCPNDSDHGAMVEVEPIDDRTLHDRYDEYLDECYSGTVKIAGLDYAVSDALKSVDPIAYRCGFSDWIDAECTDGIFVEFEGEFFNVYVK